MNHFIVIVKFSEDPLQRMDAFEQNVLDLFTDCYPEKDDGVFLVSIEKKASEVVSDLDGGDFSLSDFFLVLEIGKSAAQGMTSTTFYAELMKRLDGEKSLNDQD